MGTRTSSQWIGWIAILGYVSVCAILLSLY